MNQVFNIDCIDGMKQYPDKYFDLAVCDIEYNIGASKPSKKPELVKQKNGNLLKVKSNKYEHKNWDFKFSTDDYFKELFRVSKNQIVWGANYYSQLRGGMLVWDKLNGDSDQFDCEIAYCSFNNRTDIVYYMWQGMFQGLYCGKDIKKALIQQGNKALNEKRIHPTQKPVALYDWIFKNYAKDGDKILDTHLGSGSSRIAFEKWGKGSEFVGFELDKDYFDASVKRYNDFKSQLTLF